MPSSTSASFSDNFSELSYNHKKRKLPAWFLGKEDGKITVLGRTGHSWFLIITFYIIYYALLVGFFMGMLLIFLHYVIPEKVPLRTGDNSLLRLTPGIGIRPSVNAKATLIKYSPNAPETHSAYTSNLDAFLSPYIKINKQKSERLSTCINGKKTPDNIENVCKFPLETLGECGFKNNYGYNTDEPCVLLKLNKIYGYLPQIPEGSPVPHPLVECTGQNPVDRENLKEIKYFPEATLDGKKYGKFDNAFFPYIGQKSYLSPLVGAKITLKKKHIVVLLQCEVKNIVEHVEISKIKFEVVVD